MSQRPTDLTKCEDVAHRIELRILPLGDSITFGFQSTDGNGYRLRLEELLSGSDLHFIGSVRSGNMTDNNNEGHNGATIDQIAAFANNSLPQRPNIILLHAGTNDLHGDQPVEPYASAPERLGALIDQLISACPDSVILVAQIINNWNDDTESRIVAFNNQVPDVVAERADKGHHVMVTDMRSINGSYLKDGLHPNDVGYQKMAEIWFQRIEDAADEGWIQSPVNASNLTNNTTPIATPVPTITSIAFKAPTTTPTIASSTASQTLTTTVSPSATSLSSSSTSGAMPYVISSLWHFTLCYSVLATVLF